MENDKKICKINDSRIAKYKKRIRSGTTQVFYTGNGERDFERYRKEGRKKMHDKQDTIRIEPPEKHCYAKLINGEWWWVNGCAECNGRPRNWTTYVECIDHDICKTCKISRSKVKQVWVRKDGWQCETCKEIEDTLLKQECLARVVEKDYDEWDYYNTDKVICPHCESSYEPEGECYGSETCEVCGGEYTIETTHTITYSTEVIGNRVLK